MYILQVVLYAILIYIKDRLPTPKIERLCSISGHVEHVEGGSSQEWLTGAKVKCGSGLILELVVARRG